jgi:hypothetical protein
MVHGHERCRRQVETCDAHKNGGEQTHHADDTPTTAEALPETGWGATIGALARLCTGKVKTMVVPPAAPPRISK